jgi:hypothetical protein
MVLSDRSKAVHSNSEPAKMSGKWKGFVKVFEKKALMGASRLN